MNLHENEKNFSDAIRATASAFGIRDVFVQKDYWVCYVLKNLSLSKYRSHVVFKGGTSLSKAHKVIFRFSEDVDLAIISKDLTDSKIKQVMKNIESSIALAPLKEIKDHSMVSKGSKYRKTVWAYNPVLIGDFGDASKDLILEINSFTKPNPFNLASIQTYIADHFENINLKNDLVAYGLQAFQVNVLDLNRTTVEKIAAINNASLNQTDMYYELKNKIRHFYDLAMLLRLQDVALFVDSPQFLELFELVRVEDANFKNLKQHNYHSILDTPIFKSTNDILSILADTYEKKFMSLVYNIKNAPDIKEIKSVIELVKNSFKKYG